MIELDRLLAVAIDAARAASELLAHARPAEIRSKGAPTDLVTEHDLASEALIRERLAPTEIPIVGEEGGGAGGPLRWLVDPIDGTVNFAHGLPLWCVSIGLEDDGVPQVGVIVAPALGWTFTARRGGGAWFEDARGGGRERLRVSEIDRVARALLVTGFPYDRATSPANNFAQWEHLQRRAGACRRLGAAALDLALVAKGAFDGYWERKLKPWDVCAGALLVEEAGGRVTDTRGGRFLPQAGEAVATNGAIHEELLAELAMADAKRGQTS